MGWKNRLKSRRECLESRLAGHALPARDLLGKGLKPSASRVSEDSFGSINVITNRFKCLWSSVVMNLTSSELGSWQDGVTRGYVQKY
ncbi:hypothetical protein RRG08_041380 [Elysia crispata]|uniref:Uncharacterized protein n=1 Tax=Elysia crispata TaxID=231223 RepID=A0AAE1CL13_9GAST|nr:hypothetical protein RRG08_041380 [Elysia crispata]